MELRINEMTVPQIIEFNDLEIKQELQEKMQHYKGLIYNESQIQVAKKDLANLRKFTKALSDERIRIKKLYMKPYEDFDSKVKELCKIVDEPICLIDSQLKAYEEKRIAEKQLVIAGIYNEIGFPDWATPKQIIEENWLNASVSMKAIKSAIEEKKAKIDADLATLANLPEFGFEATEEYKRSLDINKAFSEGYRLAEIQKRKAEEAARKAEQEAAIKAATIATEAAAKAVSEVAETASEAKKQWLSFSALLSIDDAAALKSLFLERNIQFKQI